MAVFYHYMTADAVEAIKAQEILRPSLRKNRPKDVRYGNGQYFSDITPGSLSGQSLSRRLVGHPNEAERFTHYLAIDLSGLPVICGRRDVFVVRGSKNLDLTGRIRATGSIEYDLS